jgi:hypothetical protein
MGFRLVNLSFYAELIAARFVKKSSALAITQGLLLYASGKNSACS